MKNYQIAKNNLQQDIIKFTDFDGKVWWIPTDPANSDYQRYLRWLENPDADETGGIN